MEERERAIASIVEAGAYHFVLGAPVDKEGAARRAVIQRSEGRFYLEELRENKAFHRELDGEGELSAYLAHALQSGFRQLNAWTDGREYALKITKKGKLLKSSAPAGVSAPKRRAQHDRQKTYLLREGEAIGPLVDMGVMTADGRVIKAMNGKFRQINRFLEFIQDELGEMKEGKELTVVDLCCGKSYLTFVLYHYLTRVKGLSVRMLGLDLKEDVIQKSNETARKYGYEHLSFRVEDINRFAYPGEVDMVIALHACDVATDYVLYNAVRWRAKLIFAVPCCHRELNGQIEEARGKGLAKDDPMALIARYGIVKERAAALMTDALRADLLAAMGYRAQLLEFVDIEHTPKNILLRARYAPSGGEAEALAAVEAFARSNGLSPTLLTLLRGGEGGAAET